MPTHVSTTAFVALPSTVYPSVPNTLAGLILNGGTPLPGQKIVVPCRSTVTVQFAGFITSGETSVFNVWLQLYNQADPLTIVAARALSVLVNAPGTVSITPIQSAVLLPGVYYSEVVMSSNVAGIAATAGGELSITVVATGG